jgi:hypothetical protein
MAVRTAACQQQVVLTSTNGTVGKKKKWKIFGTTFSPFFCYKVIAIYICIHRLFHFFPPLYSFHNKLELHLREKKVNLRGTTSSQITLYFIAIIIAFPARSVYQEIIRENCVGPCVPVSVRPYTLQPALTC